MKTQFLKRISSPSTINFLSTSGLLIVLLVLISIAKSVVETTNASVRADALIPSPTISIEITPTPTTTPKPLPPAPTLSAKAYAVKDLKTGNFLIEHHASTQLPPASTTKLMTALVALDVLHPSQVLTVPQQTFTGSQIGLIPEERITLENLLYGLLMSSGNDAAEVIAQAHPQGLGAFVQQMNSLAFQLKMSQTSFQNPSGLDDSAHLSTARDLIQLGEAALKNPLISKIVATKQTDIYSSDQQQTHNLTNLNQLLFTEPGVTGLKTGSTPAAGGVLVTSIERDNQSLIIAVMGSEDRFADTKALIDWSFTALAP